MSFSVENENEDELTARMNAVSFSTPEEKLTNQLRSTYITARPRPVQSLPATKTTRTESLTYTSPTNRMDTSDSADIEEGWGKAPSYTSIQQGTYFGFSSIIEPNNIPIKPASDILSSKPFSQYQNMPASFVCTFNSQGEDKP